MPLIFLQSMVDDTPNVEGTIYVCFYKSVGRNMQKMSRLAKFLIIKDSFAFYGQYTINQVSCNEKHQFDPCEEGKRILKKVGGCNNEAEFSKNARY